MRMMPAIWTCLLLSTTTALAAETFGIGQTQADRRFETLTQFTRQVPCLKAGDRVLLQSGKQHVGAMNLRICGDSGPGVVEIRSDDPGRNAAIVASVTAADLGLAWKPATEAPAGATPRRGSTLFALGPLPAGRVAQVFNGQGPLHASSWPDQSAEAIPRLFITSAMKSRQQGCRAWRCIQSKAEFWPEQLKNLAALPVDQRPALVLRHSPWSYTRHTIAGIDLDRLEIAIDEATGGTATAEEKDFTGPGYGFVLFDSPAVLNAPGEWWFDAGSRQLYLVSDAAGAAALNREVRVSLADDRRDDTAALSVSPKGEGMVAVQVRITGLDVMHGAGNGILVERLSGVELDRVTVTTPADNGISVSRVERARIARATVRDTASNGVLALDVADLQLTGSSILGAGRLGLQQQLTMQFNGVRASRFTRIVIEGNQIDGVGYSGILLAERGAFEDRGKVQPAVEIVGNKIANFCRLLNDCGAIHINGGRRGERVTPDDLKAIPKKIEGNQIADPQPLLAGLPVADQNRGKAADNSGAWRRMVGAVYLDHGSSGYDVRRNTVAGSYTPFGWHVVNGGIENACDRDSARQCRIGAVGARASCYVKAVSTCNDAPPMPSK